MDPSNNYALKITLMDTIPCLDGIFDVPVKEDDDTVQTEMSQEAEDARSPAVQKHDAVKKVLSENREIFSRCSISMRGETAKPSTVFKRVGFRFIQTITEDSKVKLVSRAERIYRSFQLELSLPPKLSDTFEVGHDSIGFVQYDDLLEKKLLLLDESHQEEFLGLLLEHLELSQTRLLEIDEWLKESKKDLDFLNETLKSDFKIPNEEELGFDRPVIFYETNSPLDLNGKLSLEKDGDRLKLKNLLALLKC